MHKCIYSLFSIDLTQITHQVVYLCSFKRAVIASENMFNTVKNFLKFSLRLHWGTFIAQDIFYLPLEKMNQLDKANFRPYFYQIFVWMRAQLRIKFTWLQFHRYVHGIHRCTVMDRRNEPYWGSIGTHAHREVDAWFHWMHPQFSHRDKIRKNHIRIESLKNYSSPI